MGQINGGEALARCLAAEGVRFVEVYQGPLG